MTDSSHDKPTTVVVSPKPVAPVTLPHQKKVSDPPAQNQKVSSGRLLILTWVIVLFLVASIAVGFFYLWKAPDVWAFVVFLLGVSLELLILACVVIHAMARALTEE